MSAGARAALLSIRGLTVSFDGEDRAIPVVRGIDLDVAAGETVALVGESGSGKSVTALSIVRLQSGRIASGEVRFAGREITLASDEELRRVRGGQIGMIFQEPMSSLNPVFTVGRQIAEVMAGHDGVSFARARERTLELLARVGISSPDERSRQYPHELSGGMKQRVMMAMAIACRPRLLIADEPTTALDVTIAAQILELLRSLQREFGMAVLLITHDLGVVAHFAERVLVMYAGKVVERALVRDLFKRPAHPYTQALLAALPDPRRRVARLEAIPGRMPLPGDLPKGCAFCGRCRFAFEPCPRHEPALYSVNTTQYSACFLNAPPKATG